MSKLPPKLVKGVLESLTSKPKIPKSNKTLPPEKDSPQEESKQTPDQFWLSVSRGQVHPRQLITKLWPQIRLYDKQIEIIDSVWLNDETIVPAGNELGKDFTSAICILVFFLTREPVRIVTTSAKDDHLRVLWGEINRLIDTCAFPLKVKDGGCLIVNHQDVRKLVNGKKCPISYMRGMVASQDTIAAMQGHHANPMDPERANDGIPRTLFMSDESSSVSEEIFKMMRTWAKRVLMIGNCWPCENSFRWGVEGTPDRKDPGGDRPRPMKKDKVTGKLVFRGYERKVIKITADDSPNVKFAKEEMKRGLEPSNRILIPGVKSWENYERDERNLPPELLIVRHRAEWFKGKSSLLYPPDWVNHSKQIAQRLYNNLLHRRKWVSMGVDSGMGGDNTSWVVGDKKGIGPMVSKKTPDTNEVIAITVDLITRYNLDPKRVCFDFGGGGKTHADRLRQMGYDVQIVGFGDSPGESPSWRFKTKEDHKEEHEERRAYTNKRSQMYGWLREIMDPDGPLGGFGIHPEFHYEILRQMSVIPLLYDNESRLRMLPKRSKPGSKEQNLTQLLGCSPDELDATVLMVYGLFAPIDETYVGAVDDSFNSDGEDDYDTSPHDEFSSLE